MKNIKLFLGVPMYGGQCFGDFMSSTLGLYGECQNEGIEFNLCTLTNESLIPRARNVLVSNFLETDATHFMFIDADIAYDPKDVISMIKADKDIICGVYSKKNIRWENVRNAVLSGAPAEFLPMCTSDPCLQVLDDNRKFELDKPLEIRYGPTGFMLIKREVFEKLADKVPKHRHDNPNQPELMSVFFDTSIEGEEYLSEDWHFCNLWRKHGGQIFLAPWVTLTHIGVYKYRGGFNFFNEPPKALQLGNKQQVSVDTSVPERIM